MYTLAVILFLIPLTWKLISNFVKWKNNQSVNHKKEFLEVVIWEMITSGIFFTVLSDKSFFLALFLTSGMLGFWFWFLFDGTYNLIRKYFTLAKFSRLSYPGQYSWWFIGTVDTDESFLDNFLRSLKLWQHKLIKVGGALIFTLLYSL